MHQSESPIAWRTWLGRRRFGLLHGTRCRLGARWARRCDLRLVRNLPRLGTTGRLFCRGRFRRLCHACHWFHRPSLGRGSGVRRGRRRFMCVYLRRRVFGKRRAVGEKRAIRLGQIGLDFLLRDGRRNAHSLPRRLRLQFRGRCRHGRQFTVKGGLRLDRGNDGRLYLLRLSQAEDLLGSIDVRRWCWRRAEHSNVLGWNFRAARGVRLQDGWFVLNLDRRELGGTRNVTPKSKTRGYPCDSGDNDRRENIERVTTRFGLLIGNAAVAGNRRVVLMKPAFRS